MLTSGFQNRLLLAAVLVSLMGLLQPTAAAADPSCGSLNRLAVALHFADVIFPELKGKEFNVSLSHGNGGFIDSASEMDALQLRFETPTWQPPGETNEKLDAVLNETMEKGGVTLPFYLYFSFIELHPPILPRRLACHPVEFSSDAGERQMRKVQETLDPHPDWSNAQELEEARKLGLRYGPEDKEAVLRLIPLKELRKFYGPLKVTSADFSMNGGRKCSGCSFTDPTWRVSLSATHAVRWLSITIEPFFGRITNLSTGE
jgi:hypothetical protein